MFKSVFVIVFEFSQIQTIVHIQITRQSLLHHTFIWSEQGQTEFVSLFVFGTNICIWSKPGQTMTGTRSWCNFHLISLFHHASFGTN